MLVVIRIKSSKAKKVPRTFRARRLGTLGCFPHPLSRNQEITTKNGMNRWTLGNLQDPAKKRTWSLSCLTLGRPNLQQKNTLTLACQSISLSFVKTQRNRSVVLLMSLKAKSLQLWWQNRRCFFNTLPVVKPDLVAMKPTITDICPLVN